MKSAQQPELPLRTDVGYGKIPLQARTRAFNPVDIFVNQNRQAQIWFAVACITTLLAIGSPFWLTSKLNQRVKVVLLDKAGIIYAVDGVEFEEATEFQSHASELTALAFLNRNPNGFDMKDLIARLFLPAARKKASEQWASEEQEIRMKGIHQKAEIREINILEVRPNWILTRVVGQLVRNGVFQQRPFSEALGFTLDLKLLRNPDLSRNKHYPLAVYDFRYEAHLSP